MRTVFAGTPAFAVPALTALFTSGVDLAAVYTQPDRRAGRGQKFSPSAVKSTAQALHLPVRQPHRIEEEFDHLSDLSPDLLVVVAYGQILSPMILNLPKLGCVNVHASLLPRWRGAAPIQRAIEAGDTVTGITLMRMDQGIDTGNIIMRREMPILDNDSAGTLGTRLAELGATALADFLLDAQRLVRGASPQDESYACHARKLTKVESWLDWNRSASEVERQIRAYFPTPLSRAYLDETLILFHKAVLGPPTIHAEPGTIVRVSQNGLRVQAADGTIDALMLQIAGRKPVAIDSFLNGFSVRAGQQFSFPTPSHA